MDVGADKNVEEGAGRGSCCLLASISFCEGEGEVICWRGVKGLWRMMGIWAWLLGGGQEREARDLGHTDRLT